MITFLEPVTPPAERPTRADDADLMPGAPPLVGLADFDGPGVTGAPSLRRVGALFVQPARVALGLRGFDDAFEQVLPDGAPLVAFDLEKIIRMMLRQSGLALALLGSPLQRLAPHPHIDPRQIIQAALTRQIAHHFHDLANGLRRELAQDALVRAPDAALAITRELLTGATLCRDAALAMHLNTLRDHWPSSPTHAIVEARAQGAPWTRADQAQLAREVEALATHLDPDRALALPAQPRGYDDLQALLVSARLQAPDLLV